jgi:hypothetical protein
MLGALSVALLTSTGAFAQVPERFCVARKMERWVSPAVTRCPSQISDRLSRLRFAMTTGHIYAALAEKAD